MNIFEHIQDIIFPKNLAFYETLSPVSGNF